MNISTRWIREWANPDVSDSELSEKLTMAGLEVDRIAPVAPPFEGLVVGHVVNCDKHPNADKLSLCEIDIGDGSNLQIICGAPNVRKDLKVVVATVGSVLPSKLKIKRAKLRGVESNGMLCSESEIGLSESHEGIIELDMTATLGENIRSVLDLDDQIIELDITPNRGDCFSVLGVAREVCVNYNLSMPSTNYKAEQKGSRSFTSKVANPSECAKYLTRVIEGVDNSAQTPKWMAQKLLRASQQLHSPIVDITNYVLLELGQPMHAFDLKTINGDIEVRSAHKNEKLELLNGQTVSLTEKTLVIADEKSAIAIAGVMGGMKTATLENSSDILFESAFFDPISIAGIARSYGLHTEASLRFERGVDFNITRQALERATELVLEICGGKASKINECVDSKSLPALEPIDISNDKISKVLGFDLEPSWIESKFKFLEFDFTANSDKSWTIKPPSFRFDIRIAADIIEELARLYGYDKIPVQRLSIDANISASSQAKISSNEFSNSLVNRGYKEVITYSFISHEMHELVDPNAAKILLKNPISDDMAVMRSSLWPGLIQTAKSNIRRGHHNARFFELGQCFSGTSVADQVQKIAGIICGNRYDSQWSENEREVDFFDAKADVQALLFHSKNEYTFEAAEHPALQMGQTAKIIKDNKIIGWLGALSPKIQKSLSMPNSFLFEVNQKDIEQGEISCYEPFSSFQASQRDIAIVVSKEITADQLIHSIRSLKQDDLVDVNLFDVYEGEHIDEGSKSVALNLTYQSIEVTLTDEQLAEKVSKIVAHLESKFSAKLR
ncbi:phenylalanine--tRNA ligase subunit beta [Candidatus Pseudothioglobus sp. Uisw_016]|uniref:phenylalanine--tRNA ligase subunit beta n=1 Tax=Candidatus Pseudothioglobus sp. Uisw_016 TaxID=3230995 RepID=UPI003A8AEB6C